MAAYSDPSSIVKVIRDGTTTLKDSGGTNTFTVDYEDGDTGFAIGPGDIDEVLVIYHRNVIRGSRKAKQNPIEISFTVALESFTNSKSAASNPASLLDVISGTGGASSWTKVSSAHEHFNLDMVFKVEGTDHNDGADHEVTFAQCVFKYSISDGDPMKVSISATCLGGFTATGPA